MTDSATDRDGAEQVWEPADVSACAGASAEMNADDSADDSTEESAERASWDLPVAVVGLVLLAATTTTAAMLGMFLGWAGVGCGSAPGCNDALIITGLFCGTLGVIITAIVFLVITIARITVKRVAWWMPLVGIGAVILVFMAGALMAGVGSAGELRF